MSLLKEIINELDDEALKNSEISREFVAGIIHSRNVIESLFIRIGLDEKLLEVNND